MCFQAPKQRRCYDIVSLSKNIRPNIDRFASYAFYRIPASIDGRKNVFNKKARTGWITRREFQQFCEEIGPFAHYGTLHHSALFHCRLLGLSGTKTTEIPESSDRK